MPSAPLHEVAQVRAWMSEAFTAAGQGLPLPHRLALRGVEEVLAFGMLGGLWATACALERQGASPRVREAREAIEGALWGHWPAPLADLRHHAVEALVAGGQAGQAWWDLLSRDPRFADWAEGLLAEASARRPS